MKEQKIFVGIGGGAIQLGLWGYYANLAGLKVVIAEVDDAKVRAIRNNNNYYSLNIAYFDRIVPVTVGPVIISNLVGGDRVYNESFKGLTGRVKQCITVTYGEDTQDYNVSVVEVNQNGWGTTVTLMSDDLEILHEL